MAMTASGLKALINNELNKRKVDTTIVKSVDENGKETTSTSKQLPNDGGDAMVEALATAIVKYIQDNLEVTYKLPVTASNFDFTNLTPLNGVGGGVPGPVTLPPPSLKGSGNLEIKIPKGNFA